MTNSQQTTIPAEETYDYIIVGAGSAGCVLARRLSEDPDVRVLVLESGGSDNALIVSMPTALSIPMNTRRFNWGMTTEPEPYLGGREMNLPRGKGLGGSSSINGMCYVRGNPMDYELWHALGADGWHWRNVLPYFQRAESVRQGGDLRGTDGPLGVTRGTERNPLYAAFVRAGEQAGYARSANMNQRQHEGFGPMEMTVSNGRRCSAATAYLKPAVANGNVHVVRHAHVQHVTFSGRRVSGVEYVRGRTRNRVTARREVILSAGPIMSPALLKRSGIGPAAELAVCGIQARVHRPQVGENLMDHLEMYLQHRCIRPVSLYSHMNWLGKGLIGGRWLLRHDGLGATNHFEAGANIRSRPGVPYPDVQYHFLPLAISYDGTTLAEGHGFQVHVGTKRSRSRGCVRLRPEDPDGLPRVRFNYMSHPDDWNDMRACIRLSREIFAQPAFEPYRGEELAPGADRVSDADLDAFIRDNVETACHPCGTCRMGSDPDAVVDPTCNVNGVDGLRVVDSSVFPQATAGDLNAPTIMLAERAADLIRGRSLPPAEDAPILVDPWWPDAQRSPQISLDLSEDPEALAMALGAERERRSPVEPRDATAERSDTQ